MKSVKPMHDYILIKADEANNMTAGGIIMPDETVEESNTGVVVRVGPGVFSERMEKYLKPYSVEGSRVIFNKYGNTEVTLDGELHYLVPERSITGIIEE
jgi:chaperonin GroES